MSYELFRSLLVQRTMPLDCVVGPAPPNQLEIRFMDKCGWLQGFPGISFAIQRSLDIRFLPN